MHEEGGVGHGAVADGVGIHLAIVGADDLAVFPFGGNTFVLVAGFGVVDGVFVGPGDKTADVNHVLFDAMAVGAEEQFFEVFDAGDGGSNMTGSSNVGIIEYNDAKEKQEFLDQRMQVRDFHDGSVCQPMGGLF